MKSSFLSIKSFFHKIINRKELAAREARRIIIERSLAEDPFEGVSQGIRDMYKEAMKDGSLDFMINSTFPPEI